MFVSEVPLNSPVKITIRIKSEVIELESVVTKTGVFNGRHIMFVEPFSYNGKTVSLSKYMADVEVEPVGSSRPYKFKAEGVRYMTHKHINYHFMEYPGHMKTENRRDYYRVPFVEPATIQLTAHTATVPAYTHDLSVTGIAVTIKREQMDLKKVEIGSKISISFTLGENPRVYKVDAWVVRAVDLDEKFTLLGCQFCEFDRGIASLATLLMRKEAGRVTKNKK